MKWEQNCFSSNTRTEDSYTSSRMENWENETLINELTLGMDLANQLRFHVGPLSTTETREYLIQKILSSLEKALLILNWTELSSNRNGKRQQVSVSLLPDSSCSLDGSLHNEGCAKFHQQHDNVHEMSKKRKAEPKWTDHVRIYSETGLEGPHDDGYSWRKYGQKEILGTIYPRSYYRCIYRNTKQCLATKQVQRSDEDLAVFEITYKGKHACLADSRLSLMQSQSDEKACKQTSNAKDFPQSRVRVNAEEWNSKEAEYRLPLTSVLPECTLNVNHSSANLDGSLVQIFTSPATSGSDYMPVSIHHNSRFEGEFNTRCCSESDRSDMFSTNTSTTNSPYLDVDLSQGTINADPSFLFTEPEFFSSFN